MAKTLIPLRWKPSPKGMDYALARMAQADVMGVVAGFIEWQHRGGYLYANHDMAWQKECRDYAMKNPLLKDDGAPLLKRIPEGPVSLSERYPLPKGHVFTKNIRSLSESERDRAGAWRAKALKALEETGITSPSEAAEWMQQRMQGSANAIKDTKAN